MTLLQVLTNVGVSAATAGVVVIGAGKLFAGKWLESRFAKNLEGVKLEGQKQLEAMKQEHIGYLERLKFERTDLLDRSAKLNQREFEIIPDIWKKATGAHYALLTMIARLQESPDIGRLAEPQFAAFLEQSRLEQWQKDEIKLKSRFERTTYYSEAKGNWRYEDANLALVTFNRALMHGSIFLHPESFARIDEFGNSMRQAFRQFSAKRQAGLDGDPVISAEPDNVDSYRRSGDDEYHALGKYLRERYWVTPQGEAV